ncbi:MAG: helicase-exonuclease AddAB subunit AddB [Alkaliphilus sp.]
MKIKYIIGRSGAGKTHHIISEINERINATAENNLILIVPEQFTLQAERDLIKKMKKEGIIQVEVLSFSRLAHKVFNEVGGLSKTHINDIGKQMILRKLLNELGEDLTIYKKAYRQEGFITKLNDVIIEMKQHDIEVIDLLELNEKRDESNDTFSRLNENSIISMKMKDITLIFQAFNNYLEKRYIDTEDYINLLIEKIKEASFLKDSEIWIDSFHKMTPQTMKIVEELAKTAKEITITFTMDVGEDERSSDLFQTVKNTFNNTRKMAKRQNISEEILDLDNKNNKSTKSEVIKHIEKELYAHPYEKFVDKTEDIKIFEAVNTYQEVENVAIEIINLVREHDYRWRDVAVITADSKGYNPLIKRAFEEYRIPFFMDEKRKIIEHPILELILSAIDIVSKNFRYDDVFRYLKTELSNVEKDEHEKLENHVLRYGIRGDRWQKDHFGIELASEERENSFNIEINELRKKVILPLAKFRKSTKTKMQVSKITSELLKLLTDLQIEKKLIKWIDELKDSKRYDYANENTQIWNTVSAILEQMVEILGDNTVNLKEYGEILKAGFIASEIGVIPATIDQVLVGSIERSRSHDLKALFVVGVNDGILPSINDNSGILEEHERLQLRERGINLGLYSSSRIYEEKLAIYLAIAKPNERLFLSYALADAEGKALRQSLIIDKIKKIFSEIEVGSTANSVIETTNNITIPSSTFKYLIEKLRKTIDEDANYFDETWKSVFAWYANNTKWESKLEMAIEGLFHDNQPKNINSEKTKKLYGEQIKTSISRLERFSNCPFSHYIAYGLRPSERKKYEFTHMDAGNLFHRAIDDFGKLVREKELVWNELEPDETKLIFDEVLDRIDQDFAKGILSSTYRYKYQFELIRRVCKKAIEVLTTHLKKGDFVPLGFEISFGEGKEYPPIIVELASGEKVYIEGKIDRVDYMQDENDEELYIKIIDYKSGSKNIDFNEVFHGLQMQLLMYINAIMLGIKAEGANALPAGIFYFKIDNPLISTSEKDKEKIEKEINKTLKMKGLAVNDVKVLRSIDRDMGANSEVISAGIKKDNTVSARSSVLSGEDFEYAIEYVNHKAKKICESMLSGEMAVYPTKNKNITACTYCEFSYVCQFDTLIESNRYKNISKKSKEEIIEKIKKELEVNADD